MNVRLNALNNYSAGMIKTTKDMAAEKKITKGAAQSAAAKTDKISISANAADFSAAKIRGEISASVNSLSGADRISAIKEKVANGYFVSSEDLADRILDRFA